MTFALLKRGDGDWAMVNYELSIFWWTNSFMYHDFHEKTVEGKAHSCCCSSCCFSNSLEDMSTNVNQSSCDEITQELCSSKTDESCIGEWI